MKKNIIKKFCYILLSIMLLVAFSSCFPMDPWSYDNVIWYSEDPEIEIIKAPNVYWEGFIVKDGQKIEVELSWGPTYSFDIIDAGYELTSDGAIPADVIIYLSGRVKYDADHAFLVVEKDNLFDYKYSTITLSRRDV